LYSRDSKNNISVKLTADQEEIAVQYAALFEKGTVDATFVKNFLRDWNAVLREPHPSWDFSRLHRDAIAATAARRRPSPPAPLPRQLATIDGDTFPVTNGVVQRPGVYVARSEAHPLHGRIRARVRPEGVTLNLSRGAPTPPPPYPDSSWGRVIHQPRVSWLARWRDPLTREFKYMTVRTADLETQTQYDALKFSAAERLGREMPVVRRRLRRVLLQELERKEKNKTLWVATCAALVLEFGIRRGGGNRTVTTGATTLRANEVVLGDRKKKVVRLRFTGKDGVAFDATRRVSPELFDALELAIRRAVAAAGATTRLWRDDVSPEAVNAFMDRHMLPGLTSKVIRTHIATSIVRSRLSSDGGGGGADAMLIREMPNAALLEVAWTLNHKKRKNIAATEKREEEGSFLHALDDFWASARSEHVDRRRATEVRRTLKLAAGRLGLSPSTSKMNYVDPAVILRFAELRGLPVSVVYSPAQLARLVPRERQQREV